MGFTNQVIEYHGALAHYYQARVKFEECCNGSAANTNTGALSSPIDATSHSNFAWNFEFRETNLSRFMKGDYL